jgi:hypothetical protein
MGGTEEKALLWRKPEMTIDQIRQLSLEYAKGHVQTGPAFRTPRINRSAARRRARPLTMAEWFAQSSRHGRKAGSPPQQTNAYLTQDSGDDDRAPWE